MRTYTRQSLEQRFWTKVSVGLPDECWDWTGATVKGYGYLGRVPASSLGPEVPVFHATHASWKIHHGEFPAPGMDVCHECDRPACVNPAHLFLGTQADNNRDRYRKGRDGAQYRANYLPGAANPNSRLTAEQVREIRERYGNGGITQIALAEQYGVKQAQISRIILRTTWRE